MHIYLARHYAFMEMNVLQLCYIYMIRGVNIDEASGVVALDLVVCRAAERESRSSVCVCVWGRTCAAGDSD